jgi:DNA-binding beta-propeller fold protein YncE
VHRYQGSTGFFAGEFARAGSPTNDFSGMLGDLTFGPDNKLYVGVGSPAGGGPGDRNVGSIRRYDANSGTFIDVFVSEGNSILRWPVNFCFGPDGNLYACNADHEVLRYNGITGAFIDIFVPRGAGGFTSGLRPSGLVFGPDGNLYVSSGLNNCIFQIDGVSGALLGIFASNATSPLSNPQGLAFGPDGDLYVCSGASILRFDGTTGVAIGAFILPPSKSSYLTDLVFAEMPFRFPEFARWRPVPRWVTVIAAFALGLLLGQMLVESPGARRIRALAGR